MGKYSRAKLPVPCVAIREHLPAGLSSHQLATNYHSIHRPTTCVWHNPESSRFLAPPSKLQPGSRDRRPLRLPELIGWLEHVDQDHLRGSWGHQFSQFSPQFEFAGLTSLLHLERVPLPNLIAMTGMGKIAAERLLRFAREDIAEFRANGCPRQKRMRYSYRRMYNRPTTLFSFMFLTTIGSPIRRIPPSPANVSTRKELPKAQWCAAG